MYEFIQCFLEQAGVFPPAQFILYGSQIRNLFTGVLSTLQNDIDIGIVRGEVDLSSCLDIIAHIAKILGCTFERPDITRNRWPRGPLYFHPATRPQVGFMVPVPIAIELANIPDYRTRTNKPDADVNNIIFLPTKFTPSTDYPLPIPLRVRILPEIFFIISIYFIKMFQIQHYYLVYKLVYLEI